MEELQFGNVKVKRVFIDEFEYRTGFKVTRNCSGKMQGLWAFNTSMLVNPMCQKLSKTKGLVCEKCYAKSLLGFRKSCKERFAKNYYAANDAIWEYVPNLEDTMYLSPKVCRFEETGDLGSLTHAINYLLVALANPEVMFGFWSKHADLIHQAMQLLGVTDVPNVSFVGSSYRLNEEDSRYAKYPWINHVFTVYTGKYADEHNIETNCAAMSCIKCLRCYHKDGDFQIHEMVKSDHMARTRKKTINK